MSGSKVAIDRVRVRVLPDGRLTRRDAAAYIGVQVKTMAMWSWQGKGPRAHRISGRVYYYLEDLADFVHGDEEEKD